MAKLGATRGKIRVLAGSCCIRWKRSDWWYREYWLFLDDIIGDNSSFAVEEEPHHENFPGLPKGLTLGPHIATYQGKPSSVWQMKLSRKKRLKSRKYVNICLKISKDRNCGEVNGQVEDSSLVWTLWWSLDGCLPLAKTNSEAKLFWSKALTSEKSTNLN